jgi:hypothetical protein
MSYKRDKIYINALLEAQQLSIKAQEITATNIIKLYASCKRYKSITEISSTNSTINDDENISQKDDDDILQIDHDDNMSRKDDDDILQIDHNDNMSRKDDDDISRKDDNISRKDDDISRKDDDDISQLTQPLTAEDDYEILPYEAETFVKTCVFCLCNGHWAKNCSLIPNRFKSNCFRCWKTNHFTKNCTLKSMVKPPWMSDSDFFIFEKQIYAKVFFYLLIYF